MLKHFQDGDPWMLAEDIPDLDFSFSELWLSCFVNDFERTVGRNYSKILSIYKGLNLVFYYGEKDSNDFAEHVLGKILNNPKFGQKMNAQIRKHGTRLKKFCQKITPEFLKKLSNTGVSTLLQELDDIHTELYTWCWLPNAVDMFHANFTTYLRDILSKKLDPEEINQALVLLTMHSEKSIVQQEHESFLNLCALKQKKVADKIFQNFLHEHLEKYFYLKHLWIGKDGVYDEAYYLNEVRKFLKSGDRAEQILTKGEQEFFNTLQRKKKLIRDLKLTPREISIFDVYAEFAVTKLFRRDAQLFWAYKMDFVFAEIAKRLKISVKEARFLFPKEVLSGIRKGLPVALKKELKQRTKYCVYYAEKGAAQLFVGEEAKKIEDSLRQHSVDGITELKGQTACMGKVSGHAKIINSPSDMKKMKKGDILVSIATNPDIVPAMKLAGAIVTEQGGVTSHAAIVARELRTPCVIGTKIATKVFKDGDVIEVDANQGTVKLMNLS